MATFILLKLHSNVPESTASNLGLANVPIRVLDIVYQNQSLFAKHQYIKNIKKVLSCDMKFMKELKDIFKTQQSSTYEKMSKWRCRQTFALLGAQRLVTRGIQLRKQYVGALLKAVKKYVS